MPSTACSGIRWRLERQKLRVPASPPVTGVIARPDGSERVFNVGWVLYHILEHEAGHRGQINLLRHLERITGASNP